MTMDFSFVKKKKSVTGRKKFTREEDERLLQLVEVYGEYDWERIAATLGTRNARQCHDRWKFYINPQLNKSPFTREEDLLLISLVQQYGGMWVQISKKFHQRSDVQMKNRWKYLQKQMNLTMPVFFFPQKNSAPFSPCVCEQQKQYEAKPQCQISAPVVQQEAKIEQTPSDQLIDSIFGFSFPLFDSDQLLFE